VRINWFLVVFLTCWAGLLVLAIFDHVRKQRVKRRMMERLRQRIPHTAEEFGALYFGSNDHSATTAARLRDILEWDAGYSLVGLRPEDRLEDLTTASALENPVLFMEIEDQLCVDTSVTSWSAFKDRVEKVVTVRDLVQCILTCPKKETVQV